MSSLREVVSLDLDYPFERYGPKSADCPNWTEFRHFILWAKDDQPNGLQIMRDWSCWKYYFLSLNKVKRAGNYALQNLLKKMAQTGPISG